MIEVPGKLKKRSKVSVTMGTNPRTEETGLRPAPYTGKKLYNARDMNVNHLVPLK